MKQAIKGMVAHLSRAIHKVFYSSLDSNGPDRSAGEGISDLICLISAFCGREYREIDGCVSSSFRNWVITSRITLPTSQDAPPYFTLEFNAGLVKTEWTTAERAEQGKKVTSIEVPRI
jgi:hypothetical protein